MSLDEEEEIEAPAANCFRILIATDNHLGYLEKDPIRGNDSFEAFHEILTIARDRKVDFILLGGDLFHDNKPSRKCMHKTMTMLRQFCMGDKECQFDFVSAQDETFKDAFATVNYQDPNYNVSIPIFSIHGNHDDPSGDGDLCALDLLSAAGLVNYFGRAEAVDDVRISPMLLKKDGGVKVAVYGMGNIRDERLYRTFVGKKVRMFRPKEDKDDWFNIFVLHQNRVKRGPTNYVPESFLPDFLHLVIWGHEHDCMIDLEQNDEKGFFITQPGSSVATSLSEGEMIPKHIGILEIYPDKQFKLEKVGLQAVRPFVMDDIVLADCKLTGRQRMDEKRVDEILADKVEEMIETARNIWLEAHPDIDEDDFPRPLIRLRVDYSNFMTLNPQRFGQRFVDKVANVKDILHFHRKRQATTGDKKGKDKGIGFDMPLNLPEKLDKFQVQDLVDEFLSAQNLEILPENGIGEAVRLFVEKEDKEAISDFVQDSLKRTQLSLSKATADVIFDESNLMKQITKEKEEASAEITIERTRVFETGKSSRQAKASSGDEDEDGSDVSMDEPEPTNRKRGAAKKPVAKTAAKKRVTATRASVGTKRKKPFDSDDDDASDDGVDNDFVINSPPPLPPRNFTIPTSKPLIPLSKRSTSSPAGSSAAPPPPPPAQSSRPIASASPSTARPKATPAASGSGLRQSTLNFDSQAANKSAPSATSNSSTNLAKPNPVTAKRTTATKPAEAATPAVRGSTTSRASTIAAKKVAGRPTVFAGDSDDDDDESTTFAQFGKRAKR
ncbi:putative meiotic DNA double-strand break processing-related protein, partial [Obelidium mucronatum]